MAGISVWVEAMPFRQHMRCNDPTFQSQNRWKFYLIYIYICICHHNTDDSHDDVQGLSYQNSSLSIVQYSCDFTIQYPHKRQYYIYTFIISCLHMHTFTFVFHHNYRYKSFQKCWMTTTQFVQLFPTWYITPKTCEYIVLLKTYEP